MWANVPVRGPVMYTISGQKMDLRNLFTLKQSILTVLFIPFKWILIVMMGVLHRVKLEVNFHFAIRGIVGMDSNIQMEVSGFE